MNSIDVRYPPFVRCMTVFCAVLNAVDGAPSPAMLVDEAHNLLGCLTCEGESLAVDHYCMEQCVQRLSE